MHGLTRGSSATLVDTRGGRTGSTILVMVVLLVGLNLLTWACGLIQFGNRPALLGTMLLAYLFGLRHAVDADHIAAIDNVVRKLMQEGKTPLSAGMFFSLGHSTVVGLLTLIVAACAATLQLQFDTLRSVGRILGTGISALFLFAIAAINLMVLAGVWRMLQQTRQGERIVPEDGDMPMWGGGVLAKLCRIPLRLVSKTWHMYPLGFLFGLGFDTATEIGLLGLSAAQAAEAISLWSILIFPLLFAAGMVLVDTMDGVLMVGAYGWAFTHPVRKLWYNFLVTAISVVTALLVGGVELLGLVADEFGLGGGIWKRISDLDDSLGIVGFAIVFVLMACWLIFALIFRWKDGGASLATADGAQEIAHEPSTRDHLVILNQNLVDPGPADIAQDITSPESWRRNVIDPARAAAAEPRVAAALPMNQRSSPIRTKCAPSRRLN